MLTRRGFVKLVGISTAAVACGDNLIVTRGLFFDANGFATIDLATDLVLPGARDAKAIGYIDLLLAAFDRSPPAIFGGGPYSGRNGGDASFARFLPLSRIQELAWRIRIFGSAQTPSGDFNDALLGPTIGYRDLYLDGIARLDDVAATLQPGTAFRDLGDQDRQLALDTVASDAPAFYQALVEHTLEGTFGAPEYGGNATLVGWQLARYDGDSAPLGHATYDAASDAYVDRADQPTTTASPGDEAEDFDADVINQLTIAAVGSGGKRFF